MTGGDLIAAELAKAELEKIKEKSRPKICSDMDIKPFAHGYSYRNGDIVSYEVDGEKQRFTCLISDWCSDSEMSPPGTTFGSFHWRQLRPTISWVLHYDNFDKEAMYSEGDKVVLNQMNFICTHDYEVGMNLPDMSPVSFSGTFYWELDQENPVVKSELVCSEDGKVTLNGEEIPKKSSLRGLYQKAILGDPDFDETANPTEEFNAAEALEAFNDLTNVDVIDVQDFDGFRIVDGVMDFSVSNPDFDKLRHSAMPLPADNESIVNNTFDDFENVERINRVLSSQGFTHIFALASAPFTYDNFLKAAARFPFFCNSISEDSTLTLDQMCAKELATLFAHIIQETGKKDPSDTTVPEEWKQGLFTMVPSGCPNDDTCISSDKPEDEFYPTNTEKKYYKRSPLQISDNRLIGRFSEAFAAEGEDYLANPDLLETDGYVSFGFAIWIYMSVTHPNPSMHYVVTGQWQPNQIDIDSGANVGFGMTTMILKGNEECGSTGDFAKATIRYEIYQELMNYFGVVFDPTAIGTCSQIQPLSEGGSSYINLYWDVDYSIDPADEVQCHPVSWITPWEIMYEDSYKKCVEESADYYKADTGLDTNATAPAVPDTHDPLPGSMTVDQTTLALTVTDAKLLQIIASAKTVSGTTEPTIDTTALTTEPDNVKRAAKVLTEDKWNTLTPNRLKNFTYKAFLQNVKTHPMFCGESTRVLASMTALEAEDTLVDTCIREIAALFAHLVEESGNPGTAELSERYKYSLMRKEESGCPSEPRCWDYTNYRSFAYPPNEDVTYHGMGAYQLKGNFAYGVFSTKYLGNKHYLLQNPSKVSSSDYLSFGTMMHKYMTPSFPRPSMHDVMVGNWSPSSDETAAGLVGPFSVTTVIMGGDKYCGWGDIENKQNVHRYTNYENLLTFWEKKPLTGEIISCAKCQSFSKQLTNLPPLYFEQDWEKNIPTCMATKKKTEFSVLDPNGWSNCLLNAKGEYEDEIPEDAKVQDNLDSLLSAVNNTGSTSPVPGETLAEFKIENGQGILLADNLIRIAKSARVKQEFDTSDTTTGTEIPANVERVERVFPDTTFEKIFKSRSGHFQYQHLLDVVAFFPKFCEETSSEEQNKDNLCAEELATLLAHIIQNTGYNKDIGDTKKWMLGLFHHPVDFNCPSTATDCLYAENSEFFPAVEEQSYHPRGAGRITGNQQYGEFSEAVFQRKEELLDYPEIVNEEPLMTLGSMLWVYMTPGPKTPSMHDVVIQHWKPNDYDLAEGMKKGFGTTTYIATKGTACGNLTEDDKNRAEYFTKLMEEFGLSVPDDNTVNCTYHKGFLSKGSAALNYYWDQNPKRPRECHLVNRSTLFPIWKDNSYKECVIYFREHQTSGEEEDDFDDDQDDSCSLADTYHILGNHASDATVTDFSIPTVEGYRMFGWKAGDTNNKSGSIVTYDGLRYLCRDGKKCGLEKYTPGTLCGFQVWHLMTSAEAVTTRLDTYKPGEEYNIGDKVVLRQYEFECILDSEFCSDPFFNPISLAGESAWHFVQIKPIPTVDPTAPVDPVEAPKTGPTEASHLYDSATDANDDTEGYAIPACLTYALEKFGHRDMYKVGQIVYFESRRYVCLYEEACDGTMNPAQNMTSWRPLKTGEATDLTQDTYKPGLENATAILFGITYTCRDPTLGWCKLLANFPLLQTDLENGAWIVGDDVSDASTNGCFDVSTSKTPWQEEEERKKKEQCVSYFVGEWTGNNESYITGTLVKKDNVVYRCMEYWECKYEWNTPGDEYSAHVWEVLSGVTDLSEDTYVSGKNYKQGDKVIFHQIEYECIEYETNCSDPTLSPLIGGPWAIVDEKESTIGCDGTNIYKNQKKFIKQFTSGVKVQELPDPSTTLPIDTNPVTCDFTLETVTPSGGAPAYENPIFTDERMVNLIDSLQTDVDIARTATNASTMENVQRFKSSLSEDQFNHIFPHRNSIFTYDELVKAVSFFPKFCGEKGDTTETLDEVCLREISVILAYASVYNPLAPGTVSENEPWRQGLSQNEFQECKGGSTTEPSATVCESFADHSDKEYPPADGVEYYGRGIIPIPGNANYGKFSEEIFGNKIALLSAPELVSTTGYLAFAFALYYYMSPQSHMPSMHYIITGLWEPNEIDLMANLRPGFAASLAIFNNGFGCQENETMNIAISQSFIAIAGYLNYTIPPGETLTCEDTKPFIPGGGGDIHMYFDIDWSSTDPNCTCVHYRTPFPIQLNMAYEACVQDATSKLAANASRVDEMLPVNERVVRNTDDTFEINDKVLYKAFKSAAPVKDFPKVDLEKVTEEPENVVRFMEVFPEELFTSLFSNALEMYKYVDLVRAVKKFPSFCAEQGINPDVTDADEANELLKEACVKETATILAHIIFESGTEDSTMSPAFNGLSKDTHGECEEDNFESYCFNFFNYDYYFFSPYEGNTYQKRGCMGLAWNQNYGQFSQEILGSKWYLLADPNRVREDAYISYLSAFWFYMTPQVGRPSMHEVATQLWVPSSEQLARNIREGFGTTTNLIRGYSECGEHNDPSNSNARSSIYTEVMQLLGSTVSSSEMISCADSEVLYYGDQPIHMYNDTIDTTAVRLLESDPQPNTTPKVIYNFDVYWNENGVTCELVDYPTEFSVFNVNSLKLCLLFAKGEPYDEIPEELLNKNIKIEYNGDGDKVFVDENGNKHITNLEGETRIEFINGSVQINMSNGDYEIQNIDRSVFYYNSENELLFITKKSVKPAVEYTSDFENGVFNLKLVNREEKTVTISDVEIVETFSTGDIYTYKPDNSMRVTMENGVSVLFKPDRSTEVLYPDETKLMISVTGELSAEDKDGNVVDAATLPEEAVFEESADNNVTIRLSNYNTILTDTTLLRIEYREGFVREILPDLTQYNSWPDARSVLRPNGEYEFYLGEKQSHYYYPTGTFELKGFAFGDIISNKFEDQRQTTYGGQFVEIEEKDKTITVTFPDGGVLVKYSDHSIKYTDPSGIAFNFDSNKENEEDIFPPEYVKNSDGSNEIHFDHGLIVKITNQGLKTCIKKGYQVSEKTGGEYEFDIEEFGLVLVKEDGTTEFAYEGDDYRIAPDGTVTNLSTVSRRILEQVAQDQTSLPVSVGTNAAGEVEVNLPNGIKAKPSTTGIIVDDEEGERLTMRPGQDATIDLSDDVQIQVTPGAAATIKGFGNTITSDPSGSYEKVDDRGNKTSSAVDFEKRTTITPDGRTVEEHLNGYTVIIDKEGNKEHHFANNDMIVTSQNTEFLMFERADDRHDPLKKAKEVSVSSEGQDVVIVWGDDPESPKVTLKENGDRVRNDVNGNSTVYGTDSIVYTYKNGEGAEETARMEFAGGITVTRADTSVLTISPTGTVTGVKGSDPLTGEDLNTHISSHTNTDGHIISEFGSNLRFIFYGNGKVREESHETSIDIDASTLVVTSDDGNDIHTFDSARNYTRNVDGKSITYNASGSTKIKDDAGRETLINKAQDSTTEIFSDKTEIKTMNTGERVTTYPIGFVLTRMPTGALLLADSNGNIVYTEEPETHGYEGLNIYQNDYSTQLNTEEEFYIRFSEHQDLTFENGGSLRFEDNEKGIAYEISKDKNFTLINTHEDKRVMINTDKSIEEQFYMSIATESYTVSTDSSGNITGADANGTAIPATQLFSTLESRTLDNGDFFVRISSELTVILKTDTEIVLLESESKTNIRPNLNVDVETDDGKTFNISPVGTFTIRSGSQTMTLYEDGLVVLKDEFGNETSKRVEENGDIKIKFPDNSTETIYANGKTEFVTADGTKYENFTDGTTKITKPDGSLDIVQGHNPEGGEDLKKPEIKDVDGVTHVDFDNGLKIEIGADKKMKIKNDNFSLKRSDNGNFEIEVDGTVFDCAKDGSVAYTTPGGKDIYVDSNSNAVVGSRPAPATTTVARILDATTVNSTDLLVDVYKNGEDHQVVGIGEVKYISDGKNPVVIDNNDSSEYQFDERGDAKIMEKDGKIIDVNSEGRVMMEANGKKLETDKNGSTIQTDSHGNVTTTTMVDGKEDKVYPDGRTESTENGNKTTIFPDGFKEIILYDSTVMVFDNEDKLVHFEERKEHSDEMEDILQNKLTKDATNNVKVSFGDEDETQMEMKENGDKVVNHQDGVVSTYKVDGSMTMEYGPDGQKTLTTIAAAGDVTIAKPNGHEVSIARDGTVSGIDTSNSNAPLTGDDLKTIFTVKSINNNEKIEVQMGDQRTITSHSDGKKTETSSDYSMEYKGSDMTVHTDNGETKLTFNGNQVMTLEKDGNTTTYQPNGSSTYTNSEGKTTQIQKGDDLYTITASDGSVRERHNNGKDKTEYIAYDISVEKTSNGGLTVKKISTGEVLLVREAERNEHVEGQYSIFAHNPEWFREENSDLRLQINEREALVFVATGELEYSDSHQKYKITVSTEREISIDMDEGNHMIEINDVDVKEIFPNDSNYTISILFAGGVVSGEDDNGPRDATTVFSPIHVSMTEANERFVDIPGLFKFTFKSDDSIVQEGPGYHRTLYPDMTIDVTLENGETQTMGPNGILELKNWGESLIIDEYKSTTHIDKEGLETSKTVTNGLTRINFPDGYVEEEKEGGRKDLTSPEGEKTVHCSDGSIFLYDNNDKLLSSSIGDIYSDLESLGDIQVDLKPGSAGGVDKIKFDEGSTLTIQDNGDRTYFNAEKDETINWKDDGKLQHTIHGVTYELDQSLGVKVTTENNDVITIPKNGGSPTAVNSSGTAITDFHTQVQVTADSDKFSVSFDGNNYEVYNDGKIISHGLEDEVEYGTDKTITSKSYDGESKTVIKPDGEMTQTRDGKDTVYGTDGGVQGHDHDGNQITSVKDSDGTTITKGDGSSTHVKNDGGITKTFCSGYKVEKLPNGSTNEYDAEGNLIKSESGNASTTQNNIFENFKIRTLASGDIELTIHEENDVIVFTIMNDANKTKTLRDSKGVYSYDKTTGAITITRPNKDDPNSNDVIVIAEDGAVTETVGSLSAAITPAGVMSGDLASKIVNFLNEDNRVETKVGARLIESFASNKKVEKSHGMFREFLSSGFTKIENFEENYSVEIEEDGTATIINTITGETSVLSANGSSTITDANGNTITETVDSDGNKTIQYGDFTEKIFADGKQEFEYSDGSKGIFCKDGTSISLDKDSKLEHIHVEDDSQTDILRTDVKRGADQKLEEINFEEGEKIQFSDDKIEFIDESGGKMSWNNLKEYVVEDDEVKVTIKPNGDVEEFHKEDKITISISSDGTNVSAKDESNNEVTDFDQKTDVKKDGDKSVTMIEGKSIETNPDETKTVNYSGSQVTFQGDLSFESKSLTGDDGVKFDASTNNFIQTHDGESLDFKPDGSATKTDRDGKEINLVDNGDGTGKTMTYSDGTSSDLKNDGSMEKTLCNGYLYVKANDGSYKVYDETGKLIKSELPPEGEAGQGPDFLNIIKVHSNTDNDHVIINIRDRTLVIKPTDQERYWNAGEHINYTFNLDNTISILERNEADDGFDETTIAADGSVEINRGSDVVSVSPNGAVTGDAFHPDFTVYEHEGMMMTGSTWGLEVNSSGEGKTQFGSDYKIMFKIAGQTVIMLATGETITVESDGSCLVTNDHDTSMLQVTADGEKTLTDPSGQVTTVTFNSDGDEVTTYPDGTTAVISAGGVKETNFDNGGSAKTLPFGNYVEYNGNGDVIYYTVGHNPFKFDDIKRTIYENLDDSTDSRNQKDMYALG